MSVTLAWDTGVQAEVVVDVKQPWDTGLGARTGRAELSDESREATQPCGWDGDYRPVRQVAKSRNGVLVDRMTVPQ